jgi:hypothetical protein
VGQWVFKDGIVIETLGAVLGVETTAEKEHNLWFTAFPFGHQSKL